MIDSCPIGLSLDKILDLWLSNEERLVWKLHSSGRGVTPVFVSHNKILTRVISLKKLDISDKKLKVRIR
jgi:hypothetical protein